MQRRSRRKARRPPPTDRAANDDSAKSLRTQPQDRRLVRAIDTCTRYLESHDHDAACAIAELDEDMKTIAGRISVVGSDHSLFDLLDYVRFAETAVDYNSYRESTHEGSALVVELVALSLAAQPGTAPGCPPSAAAKIPLAEAAQRALALGHELFDLVAARRLLLVKDQAFDRDMLALVAVQRELFVRGPTYQHIIQDVLTSLFGTPEMEALCRRVLGFTGSQACELLLAIRQRCDASVREIFHRMELLKDSRNSMVEAAMRVTPSVGHDETRRHAMQALLHDAIDKIFFPIPADSTFGAPELAAATSISTTTVEHVLGALCYVAAEHDAGRAVQQAIRGPSPFRAAPILRDGDRYFMTHCGFGLHVVREAVESRLKGTPDWQQYQDWRGRFLEGEALRLLSGMLGSAQVHGGLKYFAPDPKTGEASGPPEHYSRECEADGLLIADDIALIIEAKAGNLQMRSRSGDARVLKQNLERLIGAASSQAKRLHDLIVRDNRIRLRDGKWLDVSGVREVHPIAVSLEDLSGLATAATGLLKNQIISLDFVPWMVSLYDLRVIGEIVQHGAELILYVRRRTNPEIVRTHFGFDELDFFMAFLGGGLRTDREPHEAVFALPSRARPAAGSGKAIRTEPLKFVNSHTEPLDNWYRFKHGRSTVPASRPELETEPETRAIVEALAEQQKPGWLSIGAALLDRDMSASKEPSTSS